MNTAKFTEEITVIDPVSMGEVAMSVFLHGQSGGMFAIDSSYLEQEFDDDEIPVIADPLNEDCKVMLKGV